ncbi:MAG: radical SAM protein [Thermodesulfobacteriota bacterium]
MKYRYENFGGIIASEDPPFLAFVDRAYMRELDLPPSPLWDSEDCSVGILSAPTEVHFALTNRCGAGCAHCYMGSGNAEAGELSEPAFRTALARLADMGVFHIALGGGEALERPDLFSIARFAREKGLVPNLTISGRLLTPELAERMRVFGQVNVSMDGVGEGYAVFRGKNMFPEADRALRLLVKAGVPAGINCVVGRRNADQLEELFSYAADAAANEIEFLRFKPSGRGASRYREECTTDRQNREIIPALSELSGRHDVPAKIDCSFVPMLCFHRPEKELLLSMATYGCEAGNVLLGARSDGSVCGCSFLPPTDLKVADLGTGFHGHPGIARLLRFAENAPEPCRSCDYLEICKGGCRAVALHVSGDFSAPDPGCPFVAERTGP